jgi:hypothetical protein
MNGDDKGTKKPSHKVLKVVLAVVGVLVLLGIIGNLASPSSSNAKSGGTSPAASSSSSNSGAAEAPKVPGLNQPADDGKFRFVATAFSCGKTYLVNDNEFENAHAQRQWCLLSLNVSNVQNEAQEFGSSDQYLYDDSGKQFSADTSGTSAANPSSSSCNYEQLNPGVSISCVVAFDVPKGVAVAYAKLHDSSFSDGVKMALQ